MDRGPQPNSVEPKAGLPKTIGVLNILFGILLLICGFGCFGVSVPVLRAYPNFQIDPALTQATIDDLRRQVVDELRAKEEQAKQESEKTRLRAERQRIEEHRTKVAANVDFAKLNAGTRRLWRYLWAEVVSGPILNLFMFIAGIGLAGLKGWGRRLGIWVASLKIVRLAALAIFFCFFVIPPLHEGANELFSKTDILDIAMTKSREDRQGASPFGPQSALQDPSEFVKFVKAMGYGSALLYACLGVIYPLVSVVVLTRPAAVAACARPRRSEAEGADA